jgi:hypothetical protein
MKKTNNAIFIGGIERSGTTLVNNIVGSSDDIAIFQYDLPLWTFFYNKYKNNLSSSEDIIQCIEEIFLHDRMTRCDIKLNKDEIIQDLETRHKEGGIHFGDVCESVLVHYAKQVGRRRWGLKSPYNEFYADEIFRYFPDARFIQLIRDPRDVALSHRAKSYDPFGYVALKHIFTWRKSFNLAKQNTQRYTGAYLLVNYNKLVETPETIMQEIADFLDIPLTESMKRADSHPLPPAEAQQTTHSKTAVFKSSRGRFHSEMPPPMLWLYQFFLSGEMRALDYEVIPVTISMFRKAMCFTKCLLEYLFKLPLAIMKGKIYYFLVRKGYYRHYARVFKKSP